MGNREIEIKFEKSNKPLMGARIEAIMSEFRMSLSALEKGAGIGNGTMKAWYNRPVDSLTNTIEIFLNHFQINRDWWMTGQGKIKEGEKGTRVENPSTVFRMIPYYDAVAVAGFGIIAESTPMDKPKHMINPGTFFRNAEGALQITGHSMFPKYPSGCIVAYRLASKELVLWGEDYVIELAEDRRLILKRIEKSELKGHIKAVSYNVNKDQKYMYDPIDIPLSQVGRIFMVLGKIELEAMQA